MRASFVLLPVASFRERDVGTLLGGFSAVVVLFGGFRAAFGESASDLLQVGPLVRPKCCTPSPVFSVCLSGQFPSLPAISRNSATFLPFNSMMSNILLTLGEKVGLRRSQVGTGCPQRYTRVSTTWSGLKCTIVTCSSALAFPLHDAQVADLALAQGQISTWSGPCETLKRPPHLDSCAILPKLAPA